MAKPRSETGPTFESRLLERLDQMVTEQARLSGAIEQLAAAMAGGMVVPAFGGIAARTTPPTQQPSTLPSDSPYITGRGSRFRGIVEAGRAGAPPPYAPNAEQSDGQESRSVRGKGGKRGSRSRKRARE